MSTTRRKLLLADDSATIRRVVELSFDGEAVDIVWVPEGHAVPSAVEREQPNVMLVDLSLPGRDGYDLCAWVNASGLRDRLPVVVMAGAFETVDRPRLEQLGAAAIVTKPVEPGSLVALVAELIETAMVSQSPSHSNVNETRGEERAEEPRSEGSTPLHGAGATPESQVTADRVQDGEAAPLAARGDQLLASVVPGLTQLQADQGDGDFLDRLGAALAAAGYPVPAGAPLVTQPVVSEDQVGVVLQPIGLAEGFAAVLEAEQQGIPLRAQPSVVPAAQVLTTSVLDEIARRVAARLAADPSWVRAATGLAAGVDAPPTRPSHGDEARPNDSMPRS